MPYVRISLVRPQHGREAALHSLIERLADLYSKQPGNLASYRLEHADGSNRYGRISIWRSEEDAQRAAGSERDLALRSQMNLVVDPESHEEFSFNGIAAAVPPASAGYDR